MKLILNWSKQQWLGMDAYQKVRSILICTPKVGLNKPTIEVQIFLWVNTTQSNLNYRLSNLF